MTEMDNELDRAVDCFDNMIEAIASVLESMDGMDIGDVARAVAEQVAAFRAQGKIVEVDDRRWKQHEEDWTNGVLVDTPESWGGEEAAEYIALSYVATLEARMDAAGISREKWVE